MPQGLVTPFKPAWNIRGWTHVSYFTFTISLFLLQQTVKVITAHPFMLFPDKILFDHHILVPVADLPFSQASFSTEKPLSTAGICEAVDITGYFTPHPCICEKA